ncbi:MAG: Rossmann fold nucleotide-binding protein Smf [Polyangiaceae bacterium]|jgi:DNA processing protein|nr:Rossmann fold nucleotide-binding protein Smf [Polyangiaceae bacterium]
MQELTGARLPPQLADLGQPPQRLYLEGQLPRGPAVAIVGTRGASAEAVVWVRGFASELASRGVTIVSGGAEGIDTAAHEGALAVGGLTVVVAVPGLSRPFPEQNGPLFRRVVEAGGAYLSLYPEHQAAKRGHFFARNGVLVALCHALVVGQTGVVGGSRNAAKWARELGRPLFVVPHSPWVAEGRGAVVELRLGARPLDSWKEMLRFLHRSGHHALDPGPKAAPLQGELSFPGAEPSADPVLQAVREGALHPDEIVEQTGLSLAIVQQRILTLALSGVLVPGPLGSLKLVTD